MDIGAAFEAAADAAVGSTLSPSFSPYANDISFFIGAFIFEDVGVTAYKGAAPLISSKDTLGVAAGILAVEAYHGGAIRAKLLQASKQLCVAGDTGMLFLSTPLPNLTTLAALQTVFPYESQVTALVAAVSKLRATASGSDDDRGLFKKNGNTEAFVLAPGDENAVAFSRTPSQDGHHVVFSSSRSHVSLRFGKHTTQLHAQGKGSCLRLAIPLIHGADIFRVLEPSPQGLTPKLFSIIQPFVSTGCLQVLKIVHLGAETKGGFFPQGTKGGLSPEPLSPEPPTDSADSTYRVNVWAAAIMSIAGVAASLPALGI
eukprot:1155675-Pelagomonas_calceolata.AAC.3